jgi:hypothetical protein
MYHRPLLLLLLLAHCGEAGAYCTVCPWCQQRAEGACIPYNSCVGVKNAVDLCAAPGSWSQVCVCGAQ